MATTGSGFVKATTGGTVVLFAAAKGSATSLASLLSGTRLDNPTVSLADAGLAKNGGCRLALSGTTVKTIDLTDLTLTAQAYAGDTTYASYTVLVLYNDGAASVSVASGATNGATFPGTVSVAAGDYLIVKKSSAVTVGSTAKTLDVTPTSGGSFILLVGGA